jgi:hypothetical protein
MATSSPLAPPLVATTPRVFELELRCSATAEPAVRDLASSLRLADAPER